MTNAQPTPRTDECERGCRPGIITAMLGRDLETELFVATTALADARRALEEKTEESASAQRVVSDLQEQYLVLRDERDAESARLRADLAAARAEWQDIATAPKDEEIIIHRKSGRICVAWFDKQEYHKQPRPYWRDASHFGKEQMREDWPSHWRALPTAP